MSAITLLGWLSSSPRYSEASQIIPTINGVVQALNSGVLTQLNQLIYPTIPSAPVNLLGITSANTGGTVKLTVDGQAVDTNANILLTGHGASVVSIGGTTALSANASLRVVSLANAANWLQVTGATSASPTVAVQATGATATVNLSLAGSGSGVVSVLSAATFASTVTVTSAAGDSASPLVSVRNSSGGTSAGTRIALGNNSDAADAYLQLNSSTNTAFGAGARGTALVTNGGNISIHDANVGRTLLNLGGAFFANAGQVALSGAFGSEALRTVALSNAANYLQVTGATSASPSVEVATAGASAEVFLKLTPKGSSSATVQFGNATCFAANSTVAAAFTASQGPTNARSDIQKWLRIVDQAGASYFIPMW